MWDVSGAWQQRFTLSWREAWTEILQFSNEAGVQGSFLLPESPVLAPWFPWGEGNETEEAADFISFYSRVILWSVI